MGPRLALGMSIFPVHSMLSYMKTYCGQARREHLFSYALAYYEDNHVSPLNYRSILP